METPDFQPNYQAGESIQVAYRFTYDVNDLPYWPQALSIRLPYELSGADNTALTQARLYFTPYNTIEVWRLSDFHNQRRTWINPEYPEPSRTFVDKNDIPLSNLPTHADSLQGDWEDDWSHVFIEGLAYGIPIRRHGPTTSINNQKCLFLNRFRYRIEGQLLTEHDADDDAISPIPLEGVLIKFFEDDTWLPGPNQYSNFEDKFLGEVVTDEEGRYVFEFNICQGEEDIEVYLDVRAHNPESGIKAKTYFDGFATVQNPPLFTRRAIIRPTNPVDFQNLPQTGNTLETITQTATFGTGFHTSVMQVRRALDFFNEELPNHAVTKPNITIWPHTGDAGAFFMPNTVLGILPNPLCGIAGYVCPDFRTAIHLDENSTGNENTAFHEFGHWVMWHLQDKHWIDPLTGSFANHDMDEESNPRIAWTEGWANSFAAMCDMANFDMDDEYNADGNDEYEDRPTLAPNVNEGYLSEYYLACAINDLFDGPDMFTFGIPTSTPTSSVPARIYDDMGTNGWTIDLENQIEFSFADICQPIIDHSGLTDKLHDIDDYYRALIKGRGCHERREIKRIFDNNGIVDVTGNFIGNPGFSSDAIGFDHHLLFTDNISGFDVNIEEDFFLDINNIDDDSPLPSFNMGYSTNASTWLSDDLVIENNGSLTFNGNEELDNVLVDIAPLYTPQALIQPFFLFPQPQAHIEVDLCGGMNMTIGNDGFVTLGDNGIATTAEVRVNAGSTLTLGANSNLIISEGSKLIIERGGNLEISPNANIVLEGDNSVLDIRGNLTLLPNAIFTFTGDGFVRFDLPDGAQGWSKPNIAMGPNSGFDFQGSGKSDKIVEIADYTNFSPPWGDNTLTFSWQHGKVLIGANVHIETTNCVVTFNDLAIEKLSNSMYQTVFLSGKIGSTFNDIDVSGGIVGLTYKGYHADGISAVMNNIDIHHCNIGLKTLSRG